MSKIKDHMEQESRESLEFAEMEYMAFPEIQIPRPGIAARIMRSIIWGKPEQSRKLEVKHLS